MEKERKKGLFKGKFWTKLKEKAPDVLAEVAGVAGDITGIDLLKRAGDLIKKDYNLTAEDKAELLELRAIELEELEIHYKDRESARQREAAFVQYIGRDWFMYLAGFVGLMVFTGMMYAVVKIDIATTNKEVFIHSLGIVEGIVLSIFTYYFGSSKGSKDKQQMLDKK